MTIDRLEALLALAEHGTTSRAAVALRVTQSAVSKRIAALEASCGRRLVEPDGRRVRLTADGERMVRQVRDPLADLKAALTAEASDATGTLIVGVSGSLLASWGADLLVRATQRVPGLVLEPHAHRSPVALDRVRSGDHHIALVAGESDAAPDLAFTSIGEEEMVIVPSGGRAAGLAGARRFAVLSIEPTAATWRSVARRLGHLQSRGGVDVVVERTVESFAAATRLARAGFGHALVPAGIAASLGVRRTVRLPAPGLSRPIALAARRTTWARPIAAAFRAAVVACAPDWVPRPS